MDVTTFLNSKNKVLRNNSNIEEDVKRKRGESWRVIVRDSQNTWGCFWRESQVERLSKNFVKLLAEVKKGSERYPYVGTVQQQQPIKDGKQLA